MFWIGRTAPPHRLRELLAQRGQHLALGTSAADVTQFPAIVLAPRETFAEFQELIDADRIHYLAPAELPERELAALIDSVERHSETQLPAADSLRRLALAQSLGELGAAMESAIARAVAAERGRCVVFDRERRTLWEPANDPDAERAQSAAAGLVSFVLRSGATVCLAAPGNDCRFDRDLDGQPSDRFLAVPLHADGGVAAVLAAARSSREHPFEPRDVAALEALALHAAPYLAAWLPGADDDETPFRRRALRELELPLAAGPEPLRIDPAWTRRASWLAAATVVAALIAVAYAFFSGVAHG